LNILGCESKVFLMTFSYSRSDYSLLFNNCSVYDFPEANIETKKIRILKFTDCYIWERYNLIFEEVNKITFDNCKIDSLCYFEKYKKLQTIEIIDTLFVRDVMDCNKEKKISFPKRVETIILETDKRYNSYDSVFKSLSKCNIKNLKLVGVYNPILHYIPDSVEYLSINDCKFDSLVILNFKINELKKKKVTNLKITNTILYSKDDYICCLYKQEMFFKAIPSTIEILDLSHNEKFIDYNNMFFLLNRIFKNIKQVKMYFNDLEQNVDLNVDFKKNILQYHNINIEQLKLNTFITQENIQFYYDIVVLPKLSGPTSTMIKRSFKRISGSIRRKLYVQKDFSSSTLRKNCFGIIIES